MKWVDLRSDTQTKVTREMIEALADLPIGDDDFGDDEISNLLNKKTADILGKEAAIFVPSGTFGNQVSILTHCNKTRSEIIVPSSNHIPVYEVGASAFISRAQLRQLNSPFGNIDIKELKSLYRYEEDIHQPETVLICMETLHTSGCAIPIENLRDVYIFANSVGVPVHLDGARIFNAAAALNIDVKEITKYCDSVMVAVAKGLCAPAGAMVAGSKKFIDEVRKNRKLLGGMIHKTGYLAAFALAGLNKMIPQHKIDNENAKYLADRLDEIGKFVILRNRLQGNLLFFKAKENFFNEKRFIDFLFDQKIKINPRSAGAGIDEFRFVTHYGIDKEDIDYVVEKISEFFADSNYYINVQENKQSDEKNVSENNQYQYSLNTTYQNPDYFMQNNSSMGKDNGYVNIEEEELIEIVSSAVMNIIRYKRKRVTGWKSKWIS